MWMLSTIIIYVLVSVDIKNHLYFVVYVDIKHHNYLLCGYCGR